MPIVKSNEIQLNIQFFQLCSFDHSLSQAGNTLNPSHPLRVSFLLHPLILLDSPLPLFGNFIKRITKNKYLMLRRHKANNALKSLLETL